MAGLKDAGTMKELCSTCEVLLAVCPPHAAEDVAQRVTRHAFDGLYLDANAIAPERVRRICQTLEAAGATFVDGGIVGGPAWKPGTTCLYLSGREAETVAALFSAGPLSVRVIGDQIGTASALKMCYAARTKGTTALQCAILATAEEFGVREELQRQWAQDGTDPAARIPERARNVTAKAWRFAGEMEEIAATFEDAGLPGGFHHAASEIYDRLARFKNAPATPSLEEVLAALVAQRSAG
jgi:3-hydroxyisobutyrate dehydrogenase-like beta-hydroxyacid dehydrogenase